MLAALKTPDGRDLDMALTTNGSAMAVKAQSLKDAGLKRVSVSLDSLDDATFKTMNDVDFPVAKILHGIDVAHKVGLGPIKIKHGDQTRPERPRHCDNGTPNQGLAIHLALH
jgi:GTP 3',8-cyclase